MRAGPLRHRVTIERYTDAESSYGRGKRTWTDVGRVWAGMRPTKGLEIIAGGQVRSEIPTEFVLRFRKDLTMKDRFRLGNRYFQIESINDVDGRRRELRVHAREVIPDAT